MTIKRQIRDDVKKECSCTLFEMFSSKQFASLSNNYSNGRMQAQEVESKRPQAHLR
jgi:hypothetical protein